MSLTNMLKDPNAVLDYAFDWSDWLESSEIINTHTIIVDTGITKDSDNESSGIVTIWLSGGTAGTNYTLACKIVTNEGRTDERSITIKCQER